MSVKNVVLAASMAVLLISTASSFAQSEGVLSGPTKAQLESVLSGMDLSMVQKLSLKTILQELQEQGKKVLANGSLSNAQKASQIVQARQGALGQTQKILSSPQQQQLASLLLPKK